MARPAGAPSSSASSAPGLAVTAMRRLRIMYPTSLTPGGAERQQLLLAEHLPPDRFEVSFVVVGGMTDLAREARSLGATLHVLGAPRRAGMAMPLFATKVARRVLDYVLLCRRERYDIIDAWLYHDYGLAALTRPFASVPVLIAGRRSLSAFKAGFGRAERAVDSIARWSADVIVANSQAVADDVAFREGVERSRIRVIRNGVVVPDPVSVDERRAVRASIGITDDALAIGCIGTFKRGKGQALAVKALAMARSDVPDAWLVLVGDGPERAAVDEQVRRAGLQRVLFTGPVPDARTLYPGLDVALSASDAEGLPNAVLEAAAAGLTIVATDAGGTSEIVIDGRTGILIPVGDAAGLAGGIVRVALDTGLARALGTAAREHARSAFGLQRFIDETATLYEEMYQRHLA